MSDVPSPIDVDQLMARVRAEVARRRRAANSGVPVTSSDLEEAPPFYVAKSDHIRSPKRSIGDFFVFHDKDFIDAAYQGVLKRPADPAGATHYLGLLRSGLMGKAEILGALRHSDEGMRVGVSVSGLPSAPELDSHAGRAPLVAEIQLPRFPNPEFASQAEYRLDDFLALHDADFVEAAYRGVLERAADVEGAAHFVTDLRNGSRTKIEILGALRYSDEGRRVGVRVKGLRTAFVIQRTYKLPLIGPLIALSSAILRLPRIVRSLQSLESYQHLRNAEFVAAMRQITQTVNDNERALASQVGLLLAHEQAQRWWRQHSNQRAATVERQIVDAANSFAVLDAMARSVGTAQVAQRDDIAQIQAKLETGNVSAATLERLAQIEADFRARNDNADARLAELQNRVTESAMQTDQRVAAAIVQANGYAEDSIAALHVTLASRMTDLESAGTSLSQRLAATLEGIEPRLAALESHHHASRFDALYFAFERRFRGSREDIRKRVSYYLPLLHDSVVGRQGAAVLDIGCGRGEWLELLRDEKLTARGIDTNADMARECQQRGLDVAVGDAMAHLKALPDNALGALTGFHVIEHLALDTLIELIEQAHRVVQPGGLVIFETPNPENVVVGSCNFYTDPTHQRPLPPALTQFLVEAGGFVDVQIHRVNADVLPQLVEDAGENDSPAVKAAVKLLRSAYQCAPDYSVIGQVA